MENRVKQVALAIQMEDGRSKEIKLEVWQVDAVAQMLGLRVNLSDLDDYSLSSKEHVEARMSAYHAALKETK